ncbi:MAG: glycosyltransferase [Terracidiphilus sp.]|jgi:glycosyltransferase involved in cell wall biosynthesis
MRIAVVTRYFPSSGEPAQGRSLYETLRVLSRSAEVQVFYPNAAYPKFLQPRSRTYDKLDPSFRPPDISVSYFNYPALPLISRPFNGWMTARTLLPHVRAFAPDVVFGCFLYPEGFAALRIARSLGVPVSVMSIGSDLNRIGDSLSARYTRTVLREADSIVTVCDDLRNTAVAKGAPAAKARAVLNGCDLKVFYPQDRSQARERLGIDTSCEAVVYVGRMDLKKGLRELVEAVAALHASRPRLHCYLVGRGPDRTAIEDAIRTGEAGGFVHLVPGCAFEEVATWMTAASVVTLPSYMEGCPNVILEALACGRPVVATNVGGIPEVLSDSCGRLVPPREPAKLAEALASVLDAAWNPKAVSAHGSRSWSAPATELMEVFEALVANAQGKPRVR